MSYRLPYVARCRDCGRMATIWTDGTDEQPRPLAGTCGNPARCGDRMHGFHAQVDDDLVELLAEIDVEGVPR